MARWKALARGFPTGHLRAPSEVAKFSREWRQYGFRYYMYIYIYAYYMYIDMCVCVPLSRLADQSVADQSVGCAR